MSLDINWDELLADCVDFARRLIQTPSLSHQEAVLAEMVAAEMRGWLLTKCGLMVSAMFVAGCMEVTDRSRRSS